MASGALRDYFGVGLIAARPVTPDLYGGTLGLYYATDTRVLSGWTGAAWVDMVFDELPTLEPTGGYSDGAMLIYDAALDAFVEIPLGAPGQTLVVQSGNTADWEDPPAAGVSSVNGQSGVVSLSLEDLDDVLTGTGAPDVGDVLTWSGTEWVASPAPGSGSVSSVNGQTGAVSLSLEDLDDVLTGTGAPDNGDVLTWDATTGSWVALPPSGGSRVGLAFEKELALSDLTTAITTGTTKAYFRPAFAATGVSARASLRVASSSGLPTVDVNKNAVTMMSTKLTIDASELTSLTAATPVVMSVTTWAIDDLIELDIDVAGTGAMGLIVTLTGVYA